jgi:hypothetical protein
MTHNGYGFVQAGLSVFRLPVTEAKLLIKSSLFILLSNL